MLLHNEQINEEIKREIKEFLKQMRIKTFSNPCKIDKNRRSDYNKMVNVEEYDDFSK